MRGLVRWGFSGGKGEGGEGGFEWGPQADESRMVQFEAR